MPTVTSLCDEWYTYERTHFRREAVVSFFLHFVSFFSGLFPFLAFSLSLCLYVPPRVFGPLPLLVFVELVISIMAEFSCYCWSCDRNSISLSMFDIDLHSLPGIDEVSWDIMVSGQYCTCCH
jgi:hypothetical protein